MPGIFGIVDPSAAGSSERLRELAGIVGRMCAAMQYDPGYTTGIAFHEELGGCVGRVGFPFLSETPPSQSNVFALTAGEPAVEASVAPGPAEASGGLGFGAVQLANLYQQRGPRGFAEVSGGFAAVLLDRRNARCLLFCDRYGIERLFLHTEGGVTLFSSEAKAILTVAPITRAFNPKGLAELLACGCTLGSQSLFHHVEILEGGTVMTFGRSGTTRSRYFTPSILEELAPVSREFLLEGLSASLQKSVNDCISRSPRAAVSLTGGLDSRMIMACLDAANDSVPCYTFGSMYRTTSDVSIARKVAARCGQPHHVLELSREFLSDLPEHLEKSIYISDGHLGLSGAAELYVNRMARSIAGARVTGNWGGELLRGVRAFRHTMPQGNFIRPAVLESMQESALSFSRTSSTNPLSWVLFQQLPMQGYGRYAIERSQLLMRAPFLQNEVVDWLYRNRAFAQVCTEASHAIIGRRPDLMSLPVDTGLLGRGSVAVRTVRYLHRKSLIKAEYLTSHGAPHWLALLSAALPAGVLETRFLGYDKFQHFRWWIRNELAGFVRDTLRPDNTTGLSAWLDMQRVTAMVDDHIRGKRNYTDEIDKVLTLAIAEKTLLSAQPSSTGPPLLRASTALAGS